MENIIDLLKEKDQSLMPLINKPLNDRHNKTCNYEEFIVMLGNVVKNTMASVEFLPAEEKSKILEPDRQMDFSLITFKTYNRLPLKESKPLFRHEVVETAKSGEERIGSLYAWRMQYVLQFDIFTSTYAEAQKVMNMFEDQMLYYSSYFKKNGLIECLFSEQIEDDTLIAFRDKCSIRSLRYNVTLEKYWIDFESVLESISVMSQIKDN